MSGPRFLHAGETALVVEYGETAEAAYHAKVLALDAALARASVPGVNETVPTYRSLMIHFDPRATTAEALADTVRRLAPDGVAAKQARHCRLPACYDGPHGEDLPEVAQRLDLAPERVADLHAGASYRVVMYGFAPGFVFLDGLPDELKISRRQIPRPPAQPGALTIANGQALIASIAMPTGWYVLGRTPARTFDPSRDPAFPIAVGDAVSFERIDPDRFEALLREAEAGAPILVSGG